MITPESETALADAIRSANSPLSIRGGGTRGCEIGGAPLSVSRMTGISLYEPGALTLVAQAGTPVADIETVLAAEGQRLAFEPMDHRALLGSEGEPTIGGVVSANVSGPRRIQGGAARDYALGVRFVDGTGTIIKNGGRVMKNVTGYDLVKLMAGAHGTLGVLTEVSLKVLPVPETQKSLIVNGLDDATGIMALSAGMRSPFEVTGAAHGSLVAKDGTATILRLEGFADSVDYRINALRNALQAYGAEMHVADADDSAMIWKNIRDASFLTGVEGDVWRVSCKPSDAAGLAARSEAEEWFYDWAGGLIWIRTRDGYDLRKALGVFSGHATLIRASQTTRKAFPRFHPEASGVARLSAGLRARFDPRSILNPGLMGPALQETA